MGVLRLQAFSYFALVDIHVAPGVSKKIENTVKAVRNNGFDASSQIHETTPRGALRFLKGLVTCRSNIIMVRFSDLVFPFVFFIIIYLRLRGTKIIVDIPTPRVIGLKEIDVSNSKPFFKVVRKFINVLSGSWVLLPAHCIIQYATESSWFQYGLKNKTLKLGNGILIDGTVPCVKAWHEKSPNPLNFVGVAQLANWHGFDRLIKAIHLLKQEESRVEVSFTIIGDGRERSELEQLSEKLGLKEQVVFKGMLLGKDLDVAFEDKHVGVSSLALFRKNLDEASDLKTREYMARGLPVIGVGNDPDFDNNVPYRLTVSNDENVEEVVRAIQVILDGGLYFAPEQIQQFAKRNLTLEAKMKKIFSRVGI